MIHRIPLHPPSSPPPPPHLAPTSPPHDSCTHNHGKRFTLLHASDRARRRRFWEHDRSVWWRWRWGAFHDGQSALPGRRGRGARGEVSSGGRRAQLGGVVEARGAAGGDGGKFCAGGGGCTAADTNKKLRAGWGLEARPAPSLVVPRLRLIPETLMSWLTGASLVMFF